MKSIVKTISISLILAICLSTFLPAYATIDENFKSDITNTVESFLRESAYNAYLYTDKDIKHNTIDSLTEKQKQDITKSVNELMDAKSVLPTGTKEFSVKDNSLEAHTNKMEFYRYMRQMQGIARRDFVVDYAIESVDAQGNLATVSVNEMISFYYVERDEPTNIEIEYDVSLIKYENQWYIYNLSSNDGMDSYFDPDTFNLEKELSKNVIEADDSSNEIIQELDGSLAVLQSNVLTSWPYQRNDAVNYALTYSSSGGAAYENPLFSKHSANCQNFASQSVWAGFGGDNTAASISSKLRPMDSEGTNTWYGSATQLWESHSWISCTPFRTYLANSSTDSSTKKILADIYHIPGNTNSFTGLPYAPNELVGAVMQGHGSAVDFQHAIVINYVDGNYRSNIYYTAHSPMEKNLRLSDRYPAQSTDNSAYQLKVIVPTYYVEKPDCPGRSSHLYSSMTSGNGTDSTCNNCGFVIMRVINSWKNATPVNTTLTLSATVGVQAYRIAMKVIAPNGNIEWLNYRMNSYSILNSYTFTQRGVYTITVDARDINDSITGSRVESGTFCIRIY